jgi:hypothetical protein
MGNLGVAAANGKQIRAKRFWRESRSPLILAKAAMMGRKIIHSITVVLTRICALAGRVVAVALALAPTKPANTIASSTAQYRLRGKIVGMVPLPVID